MTSEYDCKPCEANLESKTPANSVPSSEIVMTKIARVTSEVPSVQKQRELDGAERTKRRIYKVAVTLLCYPIAYLLLTMPISVVRVAVYSGAELPLPVSSAVVAIYASSGWVNVLLYTIPRKGIISWDWILFWRRGSCKYSISDSALISADSNCPQSGSSRIQTSAFDATQTCSALPTRPLPLEKCNCVYNMDFDCNQGYDPCPSTPMAVMDKAKLIHARWCEQHLATFDPASRDSNTLAEVDLEFGSSGGA
jgi:hypothetical protein